MRSVGQTGERLRLIAKHGVTLTLRRCGLGTKRKRIGNGTNYALSAD
ncbi:hypothetical protein LCGC14_0143240 [marine sediment metagenome]|uniref:Uncharacterized protein n=1 Tax=marine sediment metagenome TaxID=412755 RepID=A0A0F9XIM6_9ZZZZ